MPMRIIYFVTILFLYRQNNMCQMNKHTHGINNNNNNNNGKIKQ